MVSYKLRNLGINNIELKFILPSHCNILIREYFSIDNYEIMSIKFPFHHPYYNMTILDA